MFFFFFGPYEASINLPLGFSIEDITNPPILTVVPLEVINLGVEMVTEVTEE